MIILSNCLTETVDEGCLKVANSLVNRIKRAHPETMVISYERSSELSDLNLQINTLMLNKTLIKILLKSRQRLLYFPRVAKMKSMSVRVFLLSLFARKGISVVLVMQHPTSRFAQVLFKMSRAQIITLSRDSWHYYYDLLGDQAQYLKTGVDSGRFVPVTEAQRLCLRKKYGIPADKQVVLHVGHLNGRRNIGNLLSLDEKYHIVLVTSTWTAENQDMQLREALTKKRNLTLLEGYIPNVEEVYQLSDVYFFPVVHTHGCINVPLSVLEAASCNLPVVATPFGELKELMGCEGFYWIDSFEPEHLNELIRQALENKTDTRSSVLVYDWDRALQYLLVE